MRFAVALVMLAGCGSGDFESPAPPDMRITLDLAVSQDHPPPDLTCFNTACGGCSTWAKFDGTPAAPGDPCGWKGTLACTGTDLMCNDASCPTCASKMTGTVCGADGHTIVELTYVGNTCSVYDFGSAIDVCNKSTNDVCVGRCVPNGADYACSAHCLSDPDGGGPGCQHMPTDTCTSLAGC
jgi:hypothetical protein